MVSDTFKETKRYSAGVDPAGWQPISTAPKDGTRFKATHSNARPSDQAIDLAANCYWDGSKFQVSCFPLSKCGRFIITGQPDLWQPLPTPPHGEEG